MSLQKQNVMVMDSDPQVLKGLGLLLEDMQFEVTPAGNREELVSRAEKLTECPVLLLLPFESGVKSSGIELVIRLRSIIGQTIPAILLSRDDSYHPEGFIDQEIIVLSDQINPRELRTRISSILNNELAV